MRILIVEDDSATAQTMELCLKAAGFNCYTTDLGEEAVDLAKVYDYDAITLDLGLPDIDGIEVLRRIRAAKLPTPVLIVSGIDNIDMKVRALGGGADDYLGKPFHRDELVARLQAVVRRSQGHTSSLIQVGPVVVDLKEKRVKVGERAVHMTGKEYAMLELLALRKGATVTKEMFLNHLYGGMDEPELKIIDVFICKLRKKLAQAGARDVVQTVWGRGYRLNDEASNEPLAPGYRDPAKHPSRRHQVLSAISAHGPISFPDLLARFPKNEPDQIRGDLAGLTKHGFAENIGNKKLARYCATPAGHAFARADRAQEVAA